MPKLDGTGPSGQGKMTGRKMGKCQGAVAQNFKENGLATRRGRGQGRAFPATKED